MPISDNRFVRKQLNARLESEREVICLFAESCFLGMQVLQGDLSHMRALERVTDALTRAEHKLHTITAAIHRTGVPALEIPGLDEEERLRLFQSHFTAPDVSPDILATLIGELDLREILNDISPSLHAG